MSNYILSHTGAQIDAGIDAALNINHNLLHDPRFLVNQRAVSGTVTLAAGAYGHDRWKAGASGCTYTFSTSQGRTTLTISSGSLVQVIDGADLFYGSNTYTLSWGGTCQGKIGWGSYSASGVTGPATGGTNLSIEFGPGTLYEPQLELGSISTPFSFKDLALDIADCKRYFNTIDLSIRVYSPSSATSWAFPITWPAMRVAPTWTSSVSASANALSTTMVGLSSSSGYATIQTATTGDAYVVVKFTSSGADL